MYSHLGLNLEFKYNTKNKKYTAKTHSKGRGEKTKGDVFLILLQ